MPPLGYDNYNTTMEPHELVKRKIDVAADMMVIMNDVEILDSRERSGWKCALRPRLQSPKVYYEADLSHVTDDPSAIVVAWLERTDLQSPINLRTDIVESPEGVKEPIDQGGNIRARSNHTADLAFPYDPDLSYEGELRLLEDIAATLELIREKVPRLSGQSAENTG